VHIPDGFLDTKTIIATSVLSAAGLSRAVRNVSKEIPSRKVPLMGLVAAFVFVAQMLNFPVIGGTSGHVLGAVLVSVLVGMNAGIVIISLILLVQAFLFADGGILALGANIFNMALVGSIVGTGIYRMVRIVIPGRRGIFTGVILAAWCSTVIAAICCTGELAWSGTVAWSAGFPAMAGVHMLIGIGEAIITVLVVAAVMNTRPDLLPDAEVAETMSPARSMKEILIYGSVLIAGLALFVSPFSSRWPDGLEKVGATLGFDVKKLTDPLVGSPLAEYRIPGIGSLSVTTALAGTFGAAVVFLLAVVLVRAISRRPANPS
jgi:cobalt/nickel transport system permease protein